METPLLKKLRSSEAALLLALAGFTTLSRLPFQPATIESLDAINYMLALSHFDMSAHRPQPPGYILYILIGRAANLFVQNEHRALLLVSALFSGLAVAAIYLLGRDLFGRKAGLIAAALLATSPFFWFLGEFAAPYTGDLFFSVFSAWLCLRLSRSEGSPWLTALVLGLAGAFRPQTLVFLFPLFLISMRRQGLVRVFASSLLAGLVFAAFFIPSMLASGGSQQVGTSLTGLVWIAASWEAFLSSINPLRYAYNLFVILRGTFTTVGEALWPFFGLGFILLFTLRLSKDYPPGDSRAAIRQRILFFGAWLLPIWMVYFLLWAGNIGTMAFSLPPFLLVASAGLAWLLAHPRWRRAGPAVLLLVIAWQVTCFTVLPERPLSFYRTFMNYNALQNLADGFQEKNALVKRYPADETYIFAVNPRLPRYYLPEYATIILPPVNSSAGSQADNLADEACNPAMEDSHTIPDNIRYLVFYDLVLTNTNTAGLGLKELKLEGSAGNSSIHVARISPDETAYWSNLRVCAVKKVAR